MEEMENKERQRDEIFSKAVRAGKRTYFFDVKCTKSDDYYLTITESKKKFSDDDGKFHYEKHKLFLYKEDFEKFSNGLNEVIEFIKTGNRPVITTSEIQKSEISEFSDVSFDDLKEVSGNKEKEEEEEKEK
ncbi:MAG: DUF3276 family protein [Bacteroidales bacterium]